MNLERNEIQAQGMGVVSRVNRGALVTEAGVPLDPTELHWRRYKAATVRAPGFERSGNRRLPQARAGRFAQSVTLARGLTHVVETLPWSAVMEERSRLAREIHDTLTQAFAGILLHLEAAQGADYGGSYFSSECLARARDLARSGLEDARRMLLNLRPKSLESATLPDALRQLAEGFSCDCTITCTFCQAGHVRGLPVVIQDELYRVAQEALANVRKHSRASSASLSLGYGPGVIVLKIKDNGQGFATIKHQAAGHGYGMSTMRERARRLGGRIEINTAPGTGTEVRITVPLPGTTQIEKSKQ